MLCMMLTKYAAQVTGHIGRADDRPVDRTLLQGTYPDFKGPEA